MIQINNVSKKFKQYKKKPGLLGSLMSFFHREPIIKYAVKDFHAEIKSGEIVGLLGPNGAGKTTIMKLLTGIIGPSDGEVTVNGFKPFERKNEYRQEIALVMGQKSQLWWDIPAYDSLDLIRTYYEISDEEFDKKVKKMAKVLNVEHVLNVHVRKLSLGERMKLELMASLIHNPKLLFLDEPTIGLDLISQESIRDFLLEYHKENNCTIILTSHYMQDVSALCERIIFISEGQKKFDGTLEEFSGILGTTKRVTINFNKNIVDKTFFDQYSPEWTCDHEVQISVPEETYANAISFISSNYPISNVHTEKTPIEDVMVKLLKGINA